MQLGRRTKALLVQTIRGNDALAADNDGSPANLQRVQRIDKSIGSPNMVVFQLTNWTKSQMYDQSCISNLPFWIILLVQCIFNC